MQRMSFLFMYLFIQETTKDYIMVWKERQTVGKNVEIESHSKARSEEANRINEQSHTIQEILCNDNNQGNKFR